MITLFGDDAQGRLTGDAANCGKCSLAGAPNRRIELQRSGARSRLIAILLACAAMLQPNALFADTIPVRHTEGLIHGFLVVRTLEGKALADGQMTQDARGDRVTNHLKFVSKMVRSMRTRPYSLNAAHFDS
jgi:hypothetical protein